MSRPAALLVVDMQSVFAEADSPWHVPGFDAALAACRDLVDAHRGPVALSRFVPPPQPTGAWADYYGAWPFAADTADPRWDLVPELAQTPHPVCDAPTMGKWTAEVAAALGGPETLLLAGVATECCVLATALAAADAGVRVRLVAEACAGGTDADHDAALRVSGAFAPLVQVVRAAEAT